MTHRERDTTDPVISMLCKHFGLSRETAQKFLLSEHAATLDPLEWRRLVDLAQMLDTPGGGQQLALLRDIEWLQSRIGADRDPWIRKEINRLSEEVARLTEEKVRNRVLRSK